MIPIGGNTTAIIQTKSVVKNRIGESVPSWSDVMTVKGWLDYQGGQNTISSYDAKIQDTSHIFMCDYKSLQDVTSENSRMIIDGKIYQILMIDDPMGLHQHLEIFLKYIGGGQGV